MKNLAEKFHAGFFRKGKEHLPYIVHPKAVVETLLKWGEKPDSPAIDMAWGHDLLEDTQATDADILAVSSFEVLCGIKALTCPEDRPKARYLQDLADSGSREVLLVKMADRICNSADHVKLSGKLYAWQYLHAADCLVPALERLAEDKVVQCALQARKEFDESICSDAGLDAVRGCLLGGAAGDALGAPVEFMSREEIFAKYPGGVKDYVEFPDGTGAITDDTQMTLFTAEGLLRTIVRSLEKGVACSEDMVYRAYLRWLKTQGIVKGDNADILDSGWLIKEEQLFRYRAPGHTCLGALEDMKRAHNDSKGCGALMRMAPVGLLLPPEEAWKEGCKLAALTHGHPTGRTAAGAFAMLIAHLYSGKSLEKSLELTCEHLWRFPEASETLGALMKAQEAGSVEELGEGWTADEALGMAVYCALHHTWDIRGGIIEAVNITGDSDSVGAVTGNILGVLNGEKAIPAKWRKNLQEYKIVSCMAKDLHRRCKKSVSGQVSKSWEEKYPGW